jgi:uncharacterized membrane protein
MSRDNVMPFRPRRPRPKGPRFNLQSPRGKAILVEALTLAAVLLSALPYAPIVWPAPLVMGPVLCYLPLLPGLAALMAAAGNMSAAMPWARTHHEFVVRTLVIAGCAMVLFSLLIYVPAALFGAIAFYGRVAALLWAGLRALIGLILAIARRPIPHPRGLLI